MCNSQYNFVYVSAMAMIPFSQIDLISISFGFAIYLKNIVMCGHCKIKLNAVSNINFGLLRIH